MAKLKNYNCKQCGDLVHAKALPDREIKEGLCFECYCKKYELGEYAKQKEVK